MRKEKNSFSPLGKSRNGHKVKRKKILQFEKKVEKDTKWKRKKTSSSLRDHRSLLTSRGRTECAKTGPSTSKYSDFIPRSKWPRPGINCYSDELFWTINMLNHLQVWVLNTMYVCLYQELRGFFRLFPGCECCQRRPSEQPWHDQSALWFSCGGKKLWTWLPLLVPRWHSASQTLTFPSHCCSDFSCRGSKPEMAKGSVSCKNWLISTLPL